jgi:hypothetical protein
LRHLCCLSSQASRWKHAFLGAFAELQKATISFVMSVCLFDNFMHEINVRASVAESVKCWTTEVFISCRGRKFYPRYFVTGFGFRPAFCRVVAGILSSAIKWLGHNPLRIQYRGSECVGLYRCGIYIYIYITYLLTYLLHGAESFLRS